MKKKDIKKRLQKAMNSSPERIHVKSISLFGSHLHDTAGDDSDIDLLIELREPISMFKLVRMERELKEAFGRNVDLCTPNSISKYFREDVVKEAEPVFESAI